MLVISPAKSSDSHRYVGHVCTTFNRLTSKARLIYIDYTTTAALLLSTLRAVQMNKYGTGLLVMNVNILVIV